MAYRFGDVLLAALGGRMTEAEIEAETAAARTAWRLSNASRS